jgi:DNA-binding beta-propeller fold protein YncE
VGLKKMRLAVKPIAPEPSLTFDRIAQQPGSTQMRKEEQVSAFTWGRIIIAASLGLWGALALASEPEDAFIPLIINSSTIPSNGDLNPYGVAFVPERFPGGGTIAAGDVLVSNFNSSTNVQGTGTTIVQLTPRGPLAPPGTAVAFFTSSLPGLSTALGVLRGGFVIVGNVPTTNNGTTVGQGALQVIDRRGRLVQTLRDAQFLDGPWDLALDDHGEDAHIFVSNVLNGTVSRLDLDVRAKGVTLLKKTAIATGYTHRPDPAALVLGPTGLAFDRDTGLLYVASTADNAIFVIPHAGTRTAAVTRGAVVFADSHLRGPLALRFAPNGNLLTANGDAVNADPLHPSEIVEFTTSGQFVREYNVDSSQGGAFGLDTLREGPFNYAVIDDVTNNLSVYRLPDR